MEAGRILEYMRLALGLAGYLGRRPSEGQAAEAVARRLAGRAERFLALMDHGVYGCPGSPYRALLLESGFPHKTLCDRVRQRGLEAALAELRDAGVFLNARELKGLTPIARPKLKLEVAERDFDNPARDGSGVGGRSSGTTSAGGSVVYNWAFLAEEAQNEELLYESHGVADAPVALWYPVHVSIAGIHNLLLDLRRGKPPQRWFSQSAERGLRDTAMRWAIAAAARANGMRSPRPETASFQQAGRVAEWMGRSIRTSGSAVVRTFASSGVAAVQAGLQEGRDLRGAVVFAGGEPLGRSGASLLREAGVKAVPRYVSTETGLLGAACPSCADSGEMHVYSDRVAMIPGHDEGSPLVTTLLQSTGKILLNASLGDAGSLVERSCSCVFGQLGMSLFVHGVSSAEKFTQQGMAVEVAELDRIVGELVRQAGGAETDYQFWDRTDSGELTIAVDPSVQGLDERELIGTVLARLRERSAGGPVAAALWEGAGALILVRATPKLTAGHKLKKRIAAE